jgi:hypothetical protein
MSKVIGLSLVVAMLLGAPAFGALGETWTLPIDHRDGGGWTEYAGAGNGGTSAYGASGVDGTRRVYWALSGLGDLGNNPPSTAELYTIEFYDPSAGGDNWQPIESQFNGAGGETFPIEPGIPWDGMFGTNHQYIGSEGSAQTAGQWKSTGPGPQAPDSDAQNAGAGGIYMWLKDGSWLYAKWDFPFPIDRSWSDIRVTQITPEPASAGLLLLGGVPLLLRRRRKA